MVVSTLSTFLRLLINDVANFRHDASMQHVLMNGERMASAGAQSDFPGIYYDCFSVPRDKPAAVSRAIDELVSGHEDATAEVEHADFVLTSALLSGSFPCRIDETN